MPVVEREEETEFRRIRGGLIERFADRLRKHPKTTTSTVFGRNGEAVAEFGRLVAKLKEAGKIIVINEVGAGLEDEGRIIKRNASYEPFELLNEIRKAEVKPDGFVLNVMDIRKDVLLAVRSTKVLRVPVIEAVGKHFDEFFPEFQGEMRGKYIPISIPEEYRRRISCFELDVMETPAPSKADITFSFIQMKYSDAYLERLAACTKKGGHIITHVEYEQEVLDRVGLVRSNPERLKYAIYRVK
jgi:hypothetical protein